MILLQDKDQSLQENILLMINFNDKKKKLITTVINSETDLLTKSH